MTKREWRVSLFRRVDLARPLAGLLLCAQVVLGVPIAAEQTPKKAAATVPPKVIVNRTRPAVTPPTGIPIFSETPTDAEITRARVFSEVLLPAGPTTGAENRALADLITAYRKAAAPERIDSFEQFIREHPESGWQASLRVNLGRVARGQGAFSAALDYWTDAWRVTKDAPSATGQLVAGEALGEALAFASDLGHVPLLEHWLAESGARTFGGWAGERVRRAQSLLALLKEHPERTLLCGRQALNGLWRLSDTRPVPAIFSAPGGQERSLAQLAMLAHEHGWDLQAVRRSAGAEPPVPSIVHLKMSHYTLLVRTDGQRYLLRDPALGGEVWMTRDAFERESSGYALVPGAQAPRGWLPVSAAEAETVRGDATCPVGRPSNDEPRKKCEGGASPGGGSPPSAPNQGGGGCGGRSCGMPTYELRPLNAALLLTDTPVGYAPAHGPAVYFTLRYDARQHLQPDVRTYGHLGPQWTHDWLSFVTEVPAYCEGGGSITNYCFPARVNAYLRGGGQEEFTGPDANGVYPAHWRERAQLVRVSNDPIRYERRLADGGLEVFALPDTAPAGARRVFLTEVRDAQGHAVSLTYDSQYRLVALTDALGQVTTLSYADAADPLRLTHVTDPYGRAAHFSYNGIGQLETLTDVLGLTSRLRYGTADTVVVLTTPYGVTTFRHGLDAYNPTVQVTDAAGGTERVEYRWDTSAWPATEAAGEVPPGFEGQNAELNRYTTVYWDQRAWAAGPGSMDTSTRTRWLLWAWSPYATVEAVSVPHSVKRPLERRVWYTYPGQAPGGIGWTNQPSATARVLDDGTVQQTLATYNPLGQVTSRTDPVGRQTTYTYATNGIDLLEVRQVKPGGSDLLGQYGNYTASHQPQTVTDAAGQTTTFTYNAVGQVLTTTNAKQETTTYAYDADGRLQSVTGPVAGAITTYTYDGYGRVRTVTGPDGYVVTTDYDVFDRPWRVTYPDGSYEETTYEKLDPRTRRDRLGRVMQYFYDGLRRLRATRDPAGRTITQAWTLGGCAGCGSRDTLTDAKGQTTTWERDVQGRVVREVRADAVTATVYTYDAASGRLHTVTDPKHQVTTYAYAVDDSVMGMTFSNATIATPSVSYTYDPVYNRVATMVDGTGTTTYTYHPSGSLGAGQVASVDGPLTDDTITYTYDELGRVVSRAINGAANTTTQVYDALGRVTSETNVLGTFTYAYVGATGRLQLVTYPNGQTSSYAYYDNLNDQRLQTIHHRKPDNSTLSKFDYTYDVAGNILTWQQQADSDAPTLWTYGYDRADQLTAAVHQTTGGAPSVIKRYAYTYDPAGNRTSEQIDDAVTLATHDSLNRLLTHAPGGALVFKGGLNEPGRVTINGVPAATTAANQFQAAIPLSSGTNTVTINAVDASGNVTEAVYEVDQAGPTKTFTYDANGNMTSDGTRTFEWDARNQFVAVTVGTQRSEFSYDGLQRRVRERKTVLGVLEADKRILWCETGPCQERTSDGTSVIVQFTRQGERREATVSYLLRDGLASVQNVTNDQGALVASFLYDPWGLPTEPTQPPTERGFTGHRWHAEASLWLAMFRGYDPVLGRWISADPKGMGEGPNDYAYADNRPTVLLDYLGLSASGTQGGGCCEEIKARKSKMHCLIDFYEGKRASLGGCFSNAIYSPAALTLCGIGTLPNGALTKAAQRPDVEGMRRSLPPCWSECAVAHEMRHYDQCLRFGAGYMGTAASDRAAYMVELGCLIQKERQGCCPSSR